MIDAVEPAGLRDGTEVLHMIGGAPSRGEPLLFPDNRTESLGQSTQVSAGGTDSDLYSIDVDASIPAAEAQGLLQQAKQWMDEAIAADPDVTRMIESLKERGFEVTVVIGYLQPGQEPPADSFPLFDPVTGEQYSSADGDAIPDGDGFKMGTYTAGDTPGGGTIAFDPAAFMDKETFIHTWLHELTHQWMDAEGLPLEDHHGEYMDQLLSGLTDGRESLEF